MRGKFKSQIFNEVEVQNVNKNEVSNKWMVSNPALSDEAS